MKISFITTVFNEEKTIRQFLKSLNAQTRQPDEIVIVDGGSTDNTLSGISNFKFLISNKNVKILTKRGNRSVGRNEAIKKATGDIIVCSDSGNILDKKWIENITKPFFNQKSSSRKSSSSPFDFRHDDLMTPVDVVAGYYKGLANPTSPKASKGQGNVFQKCLIPYALVMPDKVDPNNFLPATRSIAFTKAIWKKVGGFDEKYSHNEDYVFARKLKDAGAKMVFAKDAIVNWIPRNTYKEAFVMFFRFALGDAEAGIVRKNVLLLFARYVLGFYLVFLTLRYQSFTLMGVCLMLLILYCVWAIKKNYKYTRERKAFVILPLLQFTADAAVTTGTILGASRIFLIKWIATFFFFSLVIFLPFRQLRNMFPLPEINEQKIVGYAQYFGYPFYFDTLLFFVFIFLPVISFFLCYKTSKK